MHLHNTPAIKGTATLLPASKSISNRALIIRALGGHSTEVHNLSDANDTQLMLKLVDSVDKRIDVEDAGTTMRFLTAYFAVTGQNKILTGTARMKERPIAILVDALRTLGAGIKYLENEGFPPVELISFKKQPASFLSVRGDVSSQYISALMMIAPLLPDGLTIALTGKVGSRPYIEMTASIMKHYGVTCTVLADKVIIPSGIYRATPFTVESDWSAASYWFAFVALASQAEVHLPGLFASSLQGDSVIATLMEPLGVKSEFANGLLQLTKGDEKKEITWDFTDCPDLAQTVAVVCAAKGIRGNFTGLESLRIKETDRISALQNELGKIGAYLEENDGHWTLIPSEHLPSFASIKTYKDHRMAMAFAPLLTLMNIEIEKPEVVRKSYPNFWKDIQGMGVQVS